MSALRVRKGVTIPDEALSWSASRSSGPGGQNVNRVATKVTLRFDLDATDALTGTQKRRLRRIAKGRMDSSGRLVVVSQAARTQRRNLENARAILRELISQALVIPKKRKKTRPSAAVKRRRLEAKRQRSEKKRMRRRVAVE